MNWDQIKTKWAEMARRIQAEWPDHPILTLDAAANEKRADLPADAGTTEIRVAESPPAEATGILGQNQGMASPMLDNLPIAARDASLNRM